jgi:phenylalanine ammonia-lyase
LSQMSAAHLLALCQALDIRAMNFKFLESLKPLFESLAQQMFAMLLGESEKLQNLQNVLWAAFTKRLDQLTSLDTAKRFRSATESVQHLILRSISSSVESLKALISWTEQCSELSLETYQTTREQYVLKPDATPILGSSSRKIYTFIRERLSIPFVREQTIRTPVPELADGNAADEDEMKFMGTPTVGSLTTRIYQAIRGGGGWIVFCSSRMFA